MNPAGLFSVYSILFVGNEHDMEFPTQIQAILMRCIASTYQRKV